MRVVLVLMLKEWGALCRCSFSCHSWHQPFNPSCGKDGVEAEREVSGIVLQTRGYCFSLSLLQDIPAFYKYLQNKFPLESAQVWGMVGGWLKGERRKKVLCEAWKGGWRVGEP